jgi:hypothetical protein
VDWGDVTCDGVVNAKDALYVLAYRAGRFLPSGVQGRTRIGDVIT